jgi:hypothetical protein
MLLPPDWQEEPSEQGGMGFRSLRVFQPPEAPDVRMEIFYRGLPLDEEESKAFRAVLKLAPTVIFDRNKAVMPSETDVILLRSLNGLFGNAGNNQVVNTKTDDRGPSFNVERIDALSWNGKNLLALRGWFRKPATGVRVYDYCGFFIDANPAEPECQVEEIFLEATKEEHYLRYLPIFQESLKSIEWM